MAANRIVLWRHGQTDWNVANRFQGHSDIDLNEVGKFQAKHAAQILAGMNPTAIISSDLGRARTTAQALADITGLTVSIDSIYVKQMVVYGKEKLVQKIVPKISIILFAG
jgi:probable phosphoglycerate mutase